MDKKYPDAEIPVGEPTELSSFIATHLLAYYDIGFLKCDIGLLEGDEKFFDHEDHEALSSFIAGLLAHREREREKHKQTIELRRQYAGQAMQGLLSCPAFVSEMDDAAKRLNATPDEERHVQSLVLAKTAFLIADAMIAAEAA